MTTTFRVPDMTCGGCASAIAKAVRAEDAAAGLAFDIANHVVRISSSAATAAELEAAIRSAGYTPVPAQAEAAVPARGVGCGCGCGTGAARRVDVSRPARASGGCCG